MDDKRLVYVSKYLSKHLRHEPEALGLALAPGGWVPIQELLRSAADRHHMVITPAELAEVVARSDKKRFAIDETGTLIRANQGHSAEVDLQLTAAEPPATLYHGTADRNLDSIRRDGLSKMSRHHVHLSPDAATATRVGARHGRPVVLAINATAMRRAGYEFFCSANGVWLVDHVPAAFLRFPA